jgi:hypothetical protein
MNLINKRTLYIRSIYTLIKLHNTRILIYLKYQSPLTLMVEEFYGWNINNKDSNNSNFMIFKEDRFSVLLNSQKHTSFYHMVDYMVMNWYLFKTIKMLKHLTCKVEFKQIFINTLLLLSLLILKERVMAMNWLQ